MQKLGEGAARGAQTGMLCGVIEMDGMDVLGDRHKERRNVPQVKPVTTKPAIPAHLLARPEGSPEADPKEAKRKGQSKNPNRRILLNARQRSVVTGRGAVRTYVSVAFTESAASVTRMAMPRVSAEASFVTDEDTAYADFGKHFAKHESVKHSAGFSINGINQNQAEGFNKRVERAIKGVHQNISHTHFYGYAADLALKEDLRELPTSKQLAAAMGYALRVGHSRWWPNYTHGVHRGTEILVDGERLARRHGPSKGQHPQSSAGWHPPR